MRYCFVVCLLLTFSVDAFAKQNAYLSPQCPRSPEGMVLFERGADFDFGRKGVAPSNSRAEAYYEKAFRMGDSAAGINLGKLYLHHDLRREDEFSRHSFALRVFEQVAAMGCPDGYLAMADLYGLSFSPLRNEKKHMHYWKMAVDHGSIAAFGSYGYLLHASGSDDATRKQGLILMERSLAGGNGHVAPDLAMAYRGEGRAEEMIAALRQGARLGSKKSLFALYSVYTGDSWYGQPEHKKNAAQVAALYKAIDDYEPIQPIADFDQRVPHQPVVPIKK